MRSGLGFRRKGQDMKLVYAIVRNDNEDDVVTALMQDHLW